MAAMTVVDFPQFELAGPPCEQAGCRGVLVQTISLKQDMAYQKCSVCGHQHYEMKRSELLAHSIRTIERVLAGQKVD